MQKWEQQWLNGKGEVVMVKMSGRQEDVHSYAAEMMMLIMIVTAIPDNMVVTWIGDNESVVDHYRDNEWLGEMLNTPEAEGWPNRSLKVWLLKAIKRLHARGSKLEAIHQRSHLSLRGPSSDHRVALDVVDRAAGRAHAMAKHHVNLSGWNEGCADWELFDSKGWRVDGKESGAIMQKLQQLHKDRWRNVEKQGRQIPLLASRPKLSKPDRAVPHCPRPRLPHASPTPRTRRSHASSPPLHSDNRQCRFAQRS